MVRRSRKITVYRTGLLEERQRKMKVDSAFLYKLFPQSFVHDELYLDPHQYRALRTAVIEKERGLRR